MFTKGVIYMFWPICLLWLNIMFVRFIHIIDIVVVHSFSLLYNIPFYFLFNFYWSRIDLRCCVSFSCTAKWVSYTYTYIHSFRFFSHIGHYREEFPVLYSRPLLVIYFIYSSIYWHIQSQSPNFSLFPPFPPGNHKFVFYMYDSISAL